MNDLLDSKGSFKSPVHLEFGGEYFIDAFKLKDAKFYIIHNFRGKDLKKLTASNPLAKIKSLNYSYTEVTEEISSKQKDLIYILKNGQPSFYYHL